MAADSGFLRLIFIPRILILDPDSGPFSGSTEKFPAEFLKGFIQVRNRSVQFLNGFLEFLDLRENLMISFSDKELDEFFELMFDP